MLNHWSLGNNLERSTSLRVVDVGCRFGIHPTFRPIMAISSFDLFEADRVECERLYNKYLDSSLSLRIYNYAVCANSLSEELTVKLARYSNPAVTSVSERTLNESPMYALVSEEHTLAGVIEAECCSLDDLLGNRNCYPDYLKIDVEGYEPEVIAGGIRTIANLVGVRLEVSFTRLQQQSPKSGTFSKVHDALTDLDMSLLSLDYEGKGDYWSAHCSDKYGMLRSTDAVYIRNLNLLRSSKDLSLRAAIFCFLNSAHDVGLSLLRDAAINHGKYDSFCCPLEQWMNKAVASHFHKLKWIPGQDRKEHKKVFESIFNQEYPSVNKYNESNFYNPA